MITACIQLLFYRGAAIKTILITAIKGGTGKTKVTAGLGKALARQDKKVAFLDLDYFAPNLDVELDVTAELDGDGNGHIIPSMAPCGCQFVSFGQVYVVDQAVTVAEDSAVYDIQQLLSKDSILWDSPDFLVADTAPTSSGIIQASLLVPDLLGVIIVSQPSRVSRADLLRSLSLMKDKQVPVLGVVINQAFYICPKCGHQSSAYDLSPDDITAAVNRWHVPVLGSIPHAANLDAYFDDLATKVLKTQPVVIEPDKNVTSVPRRLMTWLGKI